MDADTVRLIERLCQQLYTSTAQQERYDAERALARSFSTFSETPLLSLHPGGVHNNAPPAHVLPFTAEDPVDCLAYCQSLLNLSESPYVQMFASSHIRALIAAHFNLFPTEQKLQLRNAAFAPASLSFAFLFA